MTSSPPSWLPPGLLDQPFNLSGQRVSEFLGPWLAVRKVALRYTVDVRAAYSVLGSCNQIVDVLAQRVAASILLRLVGEVRRGRTRVFSTGPVSSQAASTRPPQPWAHRMRRRTSPTVVLALNEAASSATR